MPSTWEPYARNAAEFAARYDSVDPDVLHRPWAHLLPHFTGLALDVGAGSGRDAAWLAGRGMEVLAIEPAVGMREHAARRYGAGRVRWLDDRLPGLEATRRLDCRFDVILLNAVWLHVAPGSRDRAMRKIVELLKPGGLLVVTLRHGPLDPTRPMWTTDVEELRSLTRKQALQPLQLAAGSERDFLGRDDISWTVHAYRAPDDGTGALPVLRHVIVNDAKSSTYKLALLRVLVRIADGARGMVLRRNAERVVLPLGLVALYWLRAFQPLVVPGRRDAVPFPQVPGTTTGLGFVRESFLALGHRAPADFNSGSAFTGPDAVHLVSALSRIAATIRNMPARFTTWPRTDDPIFAVERRTVRVPRRGARVLVDRELLESFGTFEVPAHLWHAMSSYACWLEPAIVEAWSDLMRDYDVGRSRRRSMDTYRHALRWLEPERSTRDVRRRVDELRERSLPVHCVWTGIRLRDAYEIDHCFPFAAWPNSDLWNLLPASQRANNAKRDRLPSAELLHDSRERILGWWNRAFGDAADLERFDREAAASLPTVGQAGRGLDGVFAGVDLQRIRLRTDQQLAEWEGR